jgi:hypothetical protein
VQRRPNRLARLRAAALIVIAGLIHAGNLHAQTTTGTIIGRVVDPAGNPLPAASVEVLNTGRVASSGADGRFIITSIPPGAHTVRVTLLGYRQVLLEDVAVRTAQPADIRIELTPVPIEIGGVTAEAQRVRLIEPDVSASRSIIGGRELRELPVDRIEKAIELTPGVSNGHFRGGRIGQEVYVVDGLEVKNKFEASAQGMGLELSPSSLQEIEVITGGFGTQYGSALSGVVSLVTRRGSREQWEARTSLTTDQWAPSSMFYGFTGLNASAGGPLRFLGGNTTLYVDVLAQGMLDADPRARGRTCLEEGDVDESLGPSIDDLRSGVNASLYCPASSAMLPHQEGDKLIAFARLDRQLTQHVAFTTTLLRNRFQRQLYTPEFRYSAGSQLGQSVTGSLATAALAWTHERPANVWNITARTAFMRIDRYLGALDPDAFDARSTIAGFGLQSFEFFGEDFARSPIEDQLSSGAAVPGYAAPTTDIGNPFGAAGVGIFTTGGTPQLANWTVTDMGSLDLVAEMLASTGSAFRAGASGRLYKTESYERVLAGLAGSAPTYARFFPVTASAFTDGHVAVSDQINFDIGVRLDAFRSGVSFSRDRNDFLAPATEPEWNLSLNPRLGVAFPFRGSNGSRALRFNYGYVSQPPDFRYFLDTTIGDSLRTDIRRQGNPDMSFERGKAYEASFSQLILQGRAGVAVTVFRKELDDIITSSLRIGETGNQQFSTDDEGTVNGVEITTNARFGSFSGRASWAIQKATGITSGLTTDSIVNPGGLDLEYPLAFDRRHSIDLTLSAGRAAGDLESPWSASLTTVAQSGYPVTRNAVIGEDTRGARYLPWTSSTDIRVTREIGRLPGCRACAWRVTLDGRNILGLDNILAYRSDTGSLGPTRLAVADLEGTVALPLEDIPRESARYSESADPNRDGIITVQEFADARFAAALDRFDPSLFFGEPRQLRLGVEISFR